MAFTEIQTNMRGLPGLNTIKTYFIKRTDVGMYLVISFSKDILKKLSWNPQDRIVIAYDNVDNKKWMLKKSIINGYTLGRNRRIQLVWKIFTPTSEELKPGKVNFEIINNSILIDFSSKTSKKKGDKNAN